MSKQGYDVAVPPNPTPNLDFAGGYVYETYHEATHIWTVAEWDRARQTSRYLFPIATTWSPFKDPAVEARNAVHAWETVVQSLGLALPDTYCMGLDMEISQAELPGATAFCNGWRQAIRSLGLYDIVYSSRSAKGLLGDGPKWIAFDVLGGDVMAVQTGQTVVNGTTIDTDVADDSVPFYDTQGDPPKKGHKMFLLFTITDARYPQAVWVSDGVTRRWVASPAEVDALKFVAGGQGLPTVVAQLKFAQVASMPVVGDVPQ